MYTSTGPPGGEPAALPGIATAYVRAGVTTVAMARTLAMYDPDKGGTLGDPTDPRYQRSSRKFNVALANVKAMHDAGVPIALGTHVVMPGTRHEEATLQEFELLVRAGLTPPRL